MTEAMARALQAAELLRHSTAEVIDIFCSTRLGGGNGGGTFGTLSGGAAGGVQGGGQRAAAAVVARARPAHLR